MRKSILLIITLLFLNACAEYSSYLGPSYTMVKTGKVASAGNSFAASYTFKKITRETQNERECQTIHSSSLNKIFFSTLDEIDCYKDPFSILK